MSITSTLSDDVVWDGLVLAGGQSSRMGQDKALFQWQGLPLYQHMAKQLDRAGARRIWINRFADNTPESKTWLRDILPGRGPLSGIHAALEVTEAKALIVVPVDMPLLKPEHLATLIAHSDGIHPVEYNHYSLPMLLPTNKRVCEAVEQAIHSQNHKDYALWRLMEKLNSIRLTEPTDHQLAFANTNTPEEWLHACQCNLEGDPSLDSGLGSVAGSD